MTCEPDLVSVFVKESDLAGVDSSSLTIAGCTPQEAVDDDENSGFEFRYPPAECGPNVSEVGSFNLKLCKLNVINAS